MKALELIKAHESDMKSKFHVKRIGVFGSHARGDEHAESDVDVIVEFEEGQKTFDNFMDLKFYLEDLFKKKTDLVTHEALRPELKNNILSDAVYA